MARSPWRVGTVEQRKTGNKKAPIGCLSAVDRRWPALAHGVDHSFRQAHPACADAQGVGQYQQRCVGHGGRTIGWKCGRKSEPVRGLGQCRRRGAAGTVRSAACNADMAGGTAVGTEARGHACPSGATGGTFQSDRPDRRAGAADAPAGTDTTCASPTDIGVLDQPGRGVGALPEHVAHRHAVLAAAPKQRFLATGAAMVADDADP